MVSANHFTQLDAWKSSHELALSVYRLTAQFPTEEKFGLVSQMRRCAVSVSSNIAEGFGRFGNKEKVNFYSISVGSVLELESQLLLSKDLAFTSQSDFDQIIALIESTRQLTRALIKSIKAR